MSTSGGISASTIKSWFQYRCERKTRYEVMSNHELSSVPITKDEREQQWAELGIEFEHRVVEKLSENYQVLRPPRNKQLSEKQSIGFLSAQLDHEYAAQLNLKPQKVPVSMQDAGVGFRRTFPDLIRVDRSGEIPIFTLIDIKATRHATAFHKAQVAYYARILDAVLDDLSISAKRSVEGEIWRIPDGGTAQGSEYQDEVFNLAPYLRMVDDFCDKKLGEILSKEVSKTKDQTFFHIYFKCEQCAFLTHCREAISETKEATKRDLSAVPGLSHESKRTLYSLRIHNVGDLAKATGLAKLPGGSWSLQRRAKSLLDRSNALISGAVKRSSEEHTFLMPPRVDTALFLAVDHDPVDDTLVTLGYSIVRKTGVDRIVKVIEGSDRRSEADAIVFVLGKLLFDLAEIDEHNKTANDEDRQRAHIFFYEPAEAVNLHKAIARHLDDPRIRSGLLNIVRLFPPEDVVPEPEFRGAHHLPATIIRNVLEHLFAFPVMVSHDMRQISSALKSAGYIESAYSPPELFKRPFSSLLGLEISRSLREGMAKKFTVADIETDIQSRLKTSESIVDWLFREDENLAKSGQPRLLRLKKKPFMFHESFDPLSADDLDVLQAIELLDDRASMLDTLVSLAQASDRRRDSGRCISNMKLVQSSDVSGKGPPRKRLVFEVPFDSRDSDLRPGDFNLILTDDDPDIRLDPAYWASCRASYWKPMENGRPDQITLSLRKTQFETEVFQEMLQRSQGKSLWHLDRGYFDVNGNRAATFIRNLMSEAS